MSSSKALFNINRLVSDSGKDISPEVSFLSDLDYTYRKTNEHKPYYYFKEISMVDDSEYFDTSNSCINIVCIDTLPTECDKSMCYDSTRLIYHTNDQKYYVCLLSDGKPSRRYKPSSMHCIRQMYYQMTGGDMDKDNGLSGDFYSICESGEDRHLRIQKMISSMRGVGVDCDFIDVSQYVKDHKIDVEIISKKEYETKLYDRKRNIIFLCDGIVKYKGEYFIIEIKTESSRKWMDRVSVDKSHMYQAHSYSLELGINKVLFIYENRDICTKKSFLITVDDDDRKTVIDRINLCNNYIELKTVPAIEEGIEKKICQYCSYKTLCKVDGKYESTKQG